MRSQNEDYKKLLALLLVFGMLIGIFAEAMPVSAEETAEQYRTVEVPAVSTEMTAEGTNSFGNMLSDEILAKEEEQQQNNGCNIFSAEVSGKTVTVEYESVQCGTLVAAVYDDSGQQLIVSGEAEITPDDINSHTRQKTIELETAPPKYFMLKVYIIDSMTMKPMCTAYENPNYTKDMQEFFAKTTDDFDEKQVLNLDSDKTNNFAVFSDETILAYETKSANHVVTADDENEKYVITDPDSIVKKLKHGDAFALTQLDGEIVIVKVDTVTVDGAKATITGLDASMEEFFQHIRINSGILEENKSKEAARSADDPYSAEFANTEYNSNDNGSYDHTFKKKFNIQSGEIKGSDDFGKGKLGLYLDAILNVKAAFEYNLSGIVKYLRLTLDYTITGEISVRGEYKGEIVLDVPPFDPVPCVHLGITPKITMSAKVTISRSLTISGRIGYEYRNGNITDLKKDPTCGKDWDFDAEIRIGISIMPYLSIISKKVSIASIEGKVELVLHGYRDKESAHYVRHDCENCLAFDIDLELSLTFKVCLLNSKKLIAEKTFKPEEPIHIDNFYYSIDHNKFGEGFCPYKRYLTKIDVVDPSDLYINDVKVTIDDEVYTGKLGIVVPYLTAESHTIKVSDKKWGNRSVVKEVKPELNNFRIMMGDYEDDVFTYYKYWLEPEYTYISGIKDDVRPSNIHVPALLADGVTIFGEEAFKDYDFIENVRISYVDNISKKPNSAYPCIPMIRESQFENCKNLKKVSFKPESIDVSDKPITIGINWNINRYAFKNCKSLTTICLPKPIETVQIAENAFEGCDNLKDVYFAGTESQWEKAYIASGNDCLLKANIHFGSLGPDEKSSRNFSSATYMSDEDMGVTDNLKTQNLDGLNPNDVYNFYAFKSLSAESLTAPDNLLYITQFTADSEGNADISFALKEDSEDLTYMWKSLSKKDISAAEVKTADILCNGEDQFAEPQVTLDGKTLVMGKDYEIYGDFKAAVPGEFDFRVEGIGEYAGTASAVLKAYCKHTFKDGKCIVCASIESTKGDVNGDNAVGAADLVALQKYLVNKKQSVSGDPDVNADKKVNVFDVVLLRQLVLKA